MVWNNLLTCMVASAVLLAVLGWVTYWVNHEYGPSAGHMFSASLNLLVAGVLLMLAFSVNYALATTGLARLIGSESVLPKQFDFVGKILFAGSGLRTNQAFGVAVVIASFVAAGWALHSGGDLFEALKARRWRTDVWSFIGLLVMTATAVAFACVALKMDTYLLLCRSAAMMFPKQYGGQVSELPGIAAILREQSHTMGADILRLFALWYPAFILLTEKHVFSAWAGLGAVSRAQGLERAQAMGIPATPAAVPATPVLGAPAGIGVPMPPVAPVNPPVPVQGLPVITPIVTSPIPVGTGPGGAAPFERPVPFNPGPNGGNGNGRH